MTTTLSELRETYRSLWGTAGFTASCPTHGEVHHRTSRDKQPVCMPCIEAEMATQADAEDRRCGFCKAADHDLCGFCGHCAEHAFADTNSDGDVITMCCGAPIYAYDYDPT